MLSLPGPAALLASDNPAPVGEKFPERPVAGASLVLRRRT